MKAIKEELLRWTCKMHATNTYLDRRMLREKAFELSKTRGLNGFKCSERWLQNFLREHGFSTDLSDHTGPTFTNYRNWIDLMRSTIIKYKHNDLFHVDELTMYTDVPPSRHVLDEIDSESRRNRITILMGCNSSGSTKLPLLICGSYPSTTTVKEHVYYNSTDSYIKDEQFKNWLSNVNEQMFKSNRKILLFLRRNRMNALKDFEPSNLNLVYFPENFPPLLRPLRKDVFHYIKMIFRRRYAERQKQYSEKWNLRDILQSVIKAWETIPREIIIFSFQRTHFRTDDCLLQLDCDFWDKLNTNVSFKRFVTFDDKLSDEQPFNGKSYRCCAYNLRTSTCKNVLQIDEDKSISITNNDKELVKKSSSGLSPRHDAEFRIQRIPSEFRYHAHKNLKDEHRDATSIATENAVTEKKSRKRVYSETRSLTDEQCKSEDKRVKSSFVSCDSNATNSRSMGKKRFKHEEESQRQRTEADSARESLQAIVNKALTLTSLVNAEYTKKLIDSFSASLQEISAQVDTSKLSKLFKNDEETNCASEQAMRIEHAQMKENTNEISTNFMVLNNENQPSTSWNGTNSLSEIAQNVTQETKSELSTENSEKSQKNTKVSLNDEKSSACQETSTFEENRKRPSEDDPSLDEPHENRSKVDNNWSKQFETNFVFGSQNPNCSVGIRNDESTVDSSIFNAQPSDSPKE
ncbi:uncharacterized protein LOC100881183 isoform X2 [Megachile rotundata]